jgi:hypothetical protein
MSTTKCTDALQCDTLHRDQGPSDGRPEHQPTSETPTPSGLTARIRDGKPIVPTEKCLEMGDAATLQAICCRLGLAIPGLHMRTRCLPNCTQMGPHAELTESTVRENIMTGLQFLGCKSCGTYDRHNQVTVAQVALAYLRNELRFTAQPAQLAATLWVILRTARASTRTDRSGKASSGRDDWPSMYIDVQTSRRAARPLLRYGQCTWADVPLTFRPAVH